MLKKKIISSLIGCGAFASIVTPLTIMTSCGDKSNTQSLDVALEPEDSSLDQKYRVSINPKKCYKNKEFEANLSVEQVGSNAESICLSITRIESGNKILADGEDYMWENHTENKRKVYLLINANTIVDKLVIHYNITQM